MLPPLRLTGGHVEFKISALVMIAASLAFAVYFTATVVSRYRKGSLLVGSRYSTQTTVVSRNEDTRQFWTLLLVASLGAAFVCGAMLFVAAFVWSLSAVQ